MTATTNVIAKTSAGCESNKLELGAGKAEIATPTMFTPTASAVNGVKKPANRSPPVITEQAPSTDVVIVASGCTR